MNKMKKIYITIICILAVLLVTFVVVNGINQSRIDTLQHKVETSQEIIDTQQDSIKLLNHEIDELKIELNNKNQGLTEDESDLYNPQM